jgi:hypothetical protein
MKKQIFLFALMCIITINTFSQTPFTTTVKEPRFLEKTLNGRFIAIKDVTTIINFVDSGTQDNSKKESKKNDIDFFKNNGISLNLINKGEARYSASSQVIFYKLYIANPNEDNKYRINRYNLPLMLISKLSSNYDSLGASSAIDVLDYEASPVTLRIMPSFKKGFKTYNDVFYWGFYTDVRGINLQKPSENAYSMDFVGSGGIGLTYQGDGAAGTYNTNGEYESGRYSISLIYQVATGSKDIIGRLFKTDKTYVTSLQGFFLFKIDEKSKLNLKIGYQHFFQPTATGNKSNFSINIGI